VRRFAPFALLVAVAACGPAARGPAPATPAARPPSAAAPVVVAPSVPAESPLGSDPLDRRIADLSRRLRDVGASEPLPVARGFLANRESAVHDVEVPAGACVTFTALASDGIRDLDAQLFRSSGELIAADAAEDAHPTVQVCAREGEPRRLTLRETNFDGHGAYRVVAFQSPEAALSAIAGVLGGTPGREHDRAADPTAARVAERVDAARRRGFAVLAEPREVPLASSQTVWVPVVMRPAQCLLAFALPGSGLEQVSMRLLDGDGTELARSPDTEPEATLQFCGARERERVLVVTARRGAGSAQVLTFTAPTAPIGGSNSLWFGQTATRLASAAPPGRAPRDCEGIARDALARADAEGFRSALAPRCIALARGEAERVSIALEAGSCARVEAIASDGVARPSVALGVDGAPVASHVGAGLGAPAVVHACTATSQLLDATVVARSGSGLVGLVITTRRVIGPDLEAEALRLDARARAVASGGNVVTDEEGACAEASSRPLDVAPGTCARVTFVAERPVPVSVCAKRGDVSVSCDVGAAPEIAHCAPPGEHRRLEVRCRPREGDALRGYWITAVRSPMF